MKNTHHLHRNTYSILLILIGILAFGIRTIFLGRLPLNDAEAVNALQALTFTHDGASGTGGEAGYVGITSLWFFVFGAGNFGARFLPALSGAVLAMTPGYSASSWETEPRCFSAYCWRWMPPGWRFHARHSE